MSIFEIIFMIIWFIIIIIIEILMDLDEKNKINLYGTEGPLILLIGVIIPMVYCTKEYFLLFIPVFVYVFFSFPMYLICTRKESDK